MKIEVRLADDADFEAIYLLINEFATFIKTPERVTITPEQMINDKLFFRCLVAVVEDKIAGFATFFDGYSSWTGRAMYLDDLYVLEPYRGNGIGSRLLNSVIELANAEKCVKLK